MNVIEKSNPFFKKLGGFCFTYRWMIIIFSSLFFCACIWASKGLRYDNSFTAYFDQRDQIYNDFLKFRDHFGSDEIAYILYEAPDKPYGPWNIDIMRNIVEMTLILEDEVPFVKRVMSLSNVEFVEGINDSLVVHDLLLNFPDNQEDLLSIRDKVLKKPVYQNGMVSKDGKFAAIIVEMDKANVDPFEELQVDPEKGDAPDNLYPQAAHNKIKEVLSRPDYKDIKFYVTGDVPINATYNEIIKKESTQLGIISLVVIGCLLFFFLRSFIAIIGPLLIVFFSILITTAFMKTVGWQCDLIFIILPTVLIAVGVADAVHIIADVQIFNQSSRNMKQAIEKTLFIVGVPCFFTSITTIAGFYSMSISPIKAISHFAVYTAIGVFSAFFLSVTLLVALISFQRKKQTEPEEKLITTNKKHSFFNKFLEKIAEINIQHKKIILCLSAACVLFAVIGISKLHVDSNFINEFSKKIKVRTDTEFVDQIMGGSASLSFIFDTEQKDGILNSDVLADIEALQDLANEQDIVMKTYSIVDLLKNLNQTLHNEDPAYFRLPSSRKEIAQYLLVYEIAGGDELIHYITADYAMANLEIRCKYVNASEYRKMTATLIDSIKNRDNVTVIPRLTGMGALWIKLIEYIFQSQIMGFLLAYTVITIMMCLLFRSIKIGLISMVPNLSPVIITLGIMGWIGIPLDYAKLMIGCVAIGVAVDDTIHLMTRIRHEFHQSGSYEIALVNAMTHVGRALFITTSVLATGFLVFLFSEMISLNSFGTLVATTIIIAMIADFFLMPVLILIIKPFGAEKDMAV